MSDAVRTIPFDQLSDADLYVDAVYLGGENKNKSDDVIAQLIPGAGNSGGFRFVRFPRRQTPRICVLYDTGYQPDWPNSVDPHSGAVTYYGDNRKPGGDLHKTPRGGNLLLKEYFDATHASADDRLLVPPFLFFQKAGAGSAVRFRGLLAPGSPKLSPDEDLTAIWRAKKGSRFQNYRARFTVLDVDPVPRSWINALSAGESTIVGGCPEAWRKWVSGRVYETLISEPIAPVRTTQEQLPDEKDHVGRAILKAIHDYFEHKPTAFEACAVAIWRMIEPNTGKCDTTQPFRDGGRDALGQYPLGPRVDPIYIDFALEAKCYAISQSVGVEDTSRLISRLKHRDFGVFVTLSFFGKQAYEEIRKDKHPVALVCGRDVVDALRRNYEDVAAVKAWLENEFPK